MNIIRNLVNRVPYIARLIAERDQLHSKLKKQGAYPAGHYYSPVPDRGEVERKLNDPRVDEQVPDVNFRDDAQLDLLQQYATYYPELPFPETESEEHRYHFDQGWFSYTDAIILYSFLRHHQPDQIIEVGSGYSSAVMLDTTERFIDKPTQLTFIEPYADRLKSILKPSDKEQTTILEQNVQEIDMSLFQKLKPEIYSSLIPVMS